MRELGLALGRRPELETWFLLNRDLPVPAATAAAFTRYGHVAYSDDREVPRDAIHHLPSPFEPSPIDRLWPPRLRRMCLVATLHDLIPAVFPDESMPDPAVRRAYWARAELIRQADRVLTVSSATARDAARLLGIRPEKLSVTGGGVSDDFRPPASRTAARVTLGRLRDSIDAEYVLYTGGMDYRKNVVGLLEAYAGLRNEIRDRYKLVLVGRLGLSDPRGSFAEQARSLGITDRVVFAGFVPDDELVLLYQGASLFVFPSLYEGFGLPVVEALACGAPAIVGRNSSLVELVDWEEALFDAADPLSIQAALARALTEEELLERLRAPEIRDRFTWRKIAELTATAYQEVQEVPPRPQLRRGRRILCVAPLPPAGADSATTERVLAALADRCDIDLLIGDEDPHEPRAEFEPVRIGALERVSRLRHGYDGTIYWLGNSLEYALPLHVLRSRPGIVVAYNVRLTSLYALAAANRPDLEPRRFADVLRSMYGNQTGRRLDERVPLDEVEADRYGVYMAREAIAASRKFLVHIPATLPTARLEANPGDERKIDWLPLPLPTASSGQRGRKRVALFAGNGSSTEAGRVIGQLKDLSVEFRLVRETSPHSTGCSAAIAVRGAPNTPGFATFFAECVAEGLPTLLIGVPLSDHELADCVVELDGEATDIELRAALQGLDRGRKPVTPEEASASVEAVAERLLSFVNDLED